MKINDFISGNEIESETEQAAAALADEMLAFLSEQYHTVDDKGTFILQYGSTLRDLQKVKRNAKRRRGNLSHVLRDMERKSA
jgi:hypothetical protein